MENFLLKKPLNLLDLFLWGVLYSVLTSPKLVAVGGKSLTVNDFGFIKGTALTTGTRAGTGCTGTPKVGIPWLGGKVETPPGVVDWISFPVVLWKYSPNGPWPKIIFGYCLRKGSGNKLGWTASICIYWLILPLIFSVFCVLKFNKKASFIKMSKNISFKNNINKISLIFYLMKIYNFLE